MQGKKTNKIDIKGEQKKTNVEDIKKIYQLKNLDILDKEIKSCCLQFHTINLNFINIIDKCYTIPNN